MFLRNYWYVAADVKEIEDRPLARLILNEPVVMFRQKDGKVAALEDRCVHRHLPLSMGKMVDGKEVREERAICLTHHERLDGNTGMVLISVRKGRPVPRS